MKIRDLHHGKACESTLPSADRLAARVMNADEHLPGFGTAGVSWVFAGDCRKDLQPDMQVGWLHG